MNGVRCMFGMSEERLDVSTVPNHAPAIDGFAEYLNGAPFACYVNTSAEAGRSVPHLHINAVPASEVPLLKGRRSAWGVRIPGSTAVISWLNGIRYFALTVEGPVLEDVLDTLVALQEILIELKIAYNVIAVPEMCADGNRARFAIVPRGSCYIEEAQQKIAGFELMTGLLIPAKAVWEDMSEETRDVSIAKATFDFVAAQRLVAQLSDRFEDATLCKPDIAMAAVRPCYSWSTVTA